MPDQPPAAAATTTADGDGLSKTLVGRAAYFSIYASDASGARATRGGEAFVVAIRGPSPATRSIRDNGDGTYTVTYCVACSGAYTVAVTLHGEPIRGSPATLTTPTAHRNAMRRSPQTPAPPLARLEPWPRRARPR